MFDTIVKFFATKIAGLRRRAEKRTAVSFTTSETPEVLTAYEAFGRNSQSGSPRQPFKGWELWQLLEKHQPKYIAEMGSGTTSAVFALWAKKHGAKYVCYEHHPDWAKVTESCLREAGLVKDESPVRVIPSRVRDDQKATGFVESIPDDTDFVYVDGPPCMLENGTKVPNDDVVRLFDNGHSPEVIVVDGRLETVDLIREHEFGKAYDFMPSLVYCLRRRHYLDATTAPEHTVFSKS